MFTDGLKESELNKLERIGKLRNYTSGSFVVQEGLPGTSFFLVIGGTVEVRKNLAAGQYKALVELQTGDLIGELGFFGVAARSASVIATTDAQLIEFHRDAFVEFASTYPKIGMAVYRNMARILAERLASNDSSLMDTIMWALGQPRGAAPRGDDTIQKQDWPSLLKMRTTKD